MQAVEINEQKPYAFDQDALVGFRDREGITLVVIPDARADNTSASDGKP